MFINRLLCLLWSKQILLQYVYDELNSRAHKYERFVVVSSVVCCCDCLGLIVAGFIRI